MKCITRFTVVVSILFTVFFPILRGFANPQGGTVVSGKAVISQPNSGTTQIQQMTNQVILNWNSFGINPGELTQFLQPSSSSVALNRVIGANPSLILGALRSNGQIFLINPNGILFGAGAQVNVGSLVASTLDIANQDFLNGKYAFSQVEGKPLSFVINQGSITAADKGFVAFLAPLVDNEGSIVANSGSVALGGTEQAVLNIDGSGLVNLVIPASTGAHGDVIIPGSVAGVFDANKVLGAVVNNSAIVSAGQTTTDANGNVVLKAASGLAVNAVTVSANGSSHENAGNVVVNSEQATVLAPGSVISANGQDADSNGGSISVKSLGNTVFAPSASLEATGGETGNGGHLEVSADKDLWFHGKTDVSAPGGIAGSLLLDPAVLTIINGSNGSGTDDSGFISATGCNGVVTSNAVCYGTNAGSTSDTISIGALEAVTSGDVYLMATNTLQYDPNATSNAGLTLAPNVSLVLYAQTGNIALVNPAGYNLNVATQGTGSMTFYAGTTAGSGGTVILSTARGTSYLTSAGTGSISITTDGTIALGGILAGANPLTITSNSGSIEGPGPIQAGNATFQAAGDIGDNTPLNITLSGTLTATASNGNINIVNTGNLALGNITANGNTVTLTSNNGSIEGSSGTTVTAASLIATAATGIGDTTPVNTNVNNLTLTTTGANAPIVANNGTSSLANLSVTTNNSNVTVNFDSLNAQYLSFSGGVLNAAAYADNTTLDFQNTNGNISVYSVNDGTGSATLLSAEGIEAKGPGTLTAGNVTLTAARDIGAMWLALNTALSGTLTATASNGNINIMNTGNLALGPITASGNTVNLTSTGNIEGNSGSTVTAAWLSATAATGIGDTAQVNTNVTMLSLATTSASAPIVVNNGTNNLTSLGVSTNNSNVSVTSGSNQILSFISSTDVLNATSNANNTHLGFANTGGNISVGTVNYGGTSSVVLDASGGIDGGNITASIVGLKATNDIGQWKPVTTNTSYLYLATTSASAPIVVNNGTNNLTSLGVSTNNSNVSVTSGSNQILSFISSTDVLNATSNANNTSLSFINTGGNISVGTVNYGGTGNVDLQAGYGGVYNISGSGGSSSNPSITAGTLFIVGANVGNTGMLYTQINSLAGEATGNLAIENNQALNVTSFTVEGSTANLVVDKGDLLVSGSIVDHAGTVDLTTDTGNIYAGTPSSACGNICANSLALNSSGSVGTSSNPLRTAVNQLTGSSYGIFLFNDVSLAPDPYAGLTISSLTTALGPTSIMNNNGSMYVNGMETSNGIPGGGKTTLINNGGNMTVSDMHSYDQVTLKATGAINLESLNAYGAILVNAAGSIGVNLVSSTQGISLTAGRNILDINPSQLAVVFQAGANSLLKARGYIGTALEPFVVYVSHGSLGVSAGGQLNGISVDINGTVSPSGTLDILNKPPGKCLFNGKSLCGH